MSDAEKFARMIHKAVQSADATTSVREILSSVQQSATPANTHSDVEIVRRGDFYAVRLLLDIPEGELSPYTRNFTVPVDWRNAPLADCRPWERVISALVAEVLRLRGE